MALNLVPKTPSVVAAELEAAGDDRFYRKFLYFFELVIPGAATASGVPSSAIMPLMLAPQEYSIGEPFTVTTTPTVGGGLVIEENGILARPIRIRGTTGFQPRFLTNAPWGTDLVKTDLLSFTPRGQVPLISTMSGQKQFELIQDRIFRLYGDLKRNPETSRRTKLFWHNVKDDEHWQVIPQGFGLTRAIPRTTMYHYDIQLLAVAPTRREDIDISEDRSLLQVIGDIARTIREAVDMIKGTIDNVTALVQDVANLVRSFGNAVTSLAGVITSVTNLVGAAENFINGVTSAITSPLRLAQDIVTNVEGLIDALDSVYQTGAAFPATIQAEIEDIGRAVNRLISHPEWFETPADAANRRFREQGGLRVGDVIVTSRSLAQALRAGTALGPGDVAKNQAERMGAGRAAPPRGSAAIRNIGQAQTIEDLAAAYLGDAGRWSEIAALNGLRSPYIHPAGLPGTLRPGDSILIPSDAPSPRTAVLPICLGSQLTDPEEERLFCVDLRIAPVVDPRTSTAQYDLVLDDGHNADVKVIRGIKNLIQAVGTRLRTEQGDSALYRTLGVEPTLGGSGVPFVDRETAALRYAAAVQADPRIIDVRNVRLGPGSPDVIDVEMDAAVYGLSGRVTVQTTT